MARTGKIARLPLAIREEINRRLLEGQAASKILPWLNGLEEVKAILEEDFEGLHVSDKNLSDWRNGGFAEWEARLDRVAHTKELAAWSVKFAEAGGGSIAEGASQIVAGKVLEVLEKLDDLVKSDSIPSPLEGERAGERGSDILTAIDGLTLAVSRLRKGDQDAEVLRQNRERLAQGAQTIEQRQQTIELERQKFQRTTCELFLKWREDTRAREIADGPGTTADKVERLGQAMFGDLWEQ